MEIKGTAVKPTKDFVLNKFKDRFNEWMNSLEENTRNIYADPIYANSWYDLHEIVIKPTKNIGELFYYGDLKKAAWEVGRYSSESALKGVYKIFIRISTPSFILGRASRVFASYYHPSDTKIIESSSTMAVFKLANFEERDEIIIYRIAGWMERTVEITQGKNIQVDTEKINENGKPAWIIKVNWS